MVYETGPNMSQNELLKHIDKRMDEMRGDMKDNIADIKDLIGDHLKNCDEHMKGHNDRITNLEASENKRLGAVGILGVIITIIGIFVAYTRG